MTSKETTFRGIRLVIILFAAAGIAAAISSATFGNDPPEREKNLPASGMFTGEIIFPIYASDVKLSAEFYRDILGFEFLGYYDYATNSYVTSWEDSLPPKYAGFLAGDQKFGLHLPANDTQQACVGCGRYYFRVQDLDAEHSRISAHGVKMSRIHSSALLRRFYVPDPDGLMVFFAETAAGAPLDPW
jgi:predicted enzyme related to lactoylglutathione lyase